MNHDLFLRQPFMSETGAAACDAQALVAAMCAFESSLARVQARAGHISAESADTIGKAVQADAFDVQALAVAAADGGNVAIPFVRQARALLPPEVKPCLHKGATSQDVIDTALMLVLKPRLQSCARQLEKALAAGAGLMERHRATPMIGRTLTQQALPITFGAKLAQWLSSLLAGQSRLQEVLATGLPVQLGGPVGAHHGIDDGLELMAMLADELGLNCPLLPWHTNRQPVLILIDSVGAVAVAAEKIATDVAFMAQTEVGELREPAAAGSGSSSSMPHKANPVGSVRIRAAARQIHATVTTLHNAGAQAHERSLGAWHAEWAPLVDAVLLLEGALETLAVLLSGLQVDVAAMRNNLERTGGAILLQPTLALLSEFMPRRQARRIADEAVAVARHGHQSYVNALLAVPEVGQKVDEQRLRAAVDPAAYVGTSLAQVARVRAWLHSS